jgi:hypothetical protein
VPRLLPVLAVLFLAVLLMGLATSTTGCSKQPESLVGTWRSDQEGETLEFRTDGILYFTTSTGEAETLRWQADDRSLAIGVAGGGTKNFGYSIEDGVLTLTFPDVEPAKYTRIELQSD